MLNFTIDLGQIILITLVAIIGYFVQRTLESFEARLDKHDDILLKLVGDVQRLIGTVTKYDSD